jgi:hypothetical protein
MFRVEYQSHRCVKLAIQANSEGKVVGSIVVISIQMSLVR